jgi:hypothetical protein
MAFLALSPAVFSRLSPVPFNPLLPRRFHPPGAAPPPEPGAPRVRPGRCGCALRWPIRGRRRRSVPGGRMNSPGSPAGNTRRHGRPPANRTAGASPGMPRGCRSPSSRCVPPRRGRTETQPDIRPIGLAAFSGDFREQTTLAGGHRNRGSPPAPCPTAQPRCSKDAPEYVLWGNWRGKTNTTSSTTARAPSASAICATVTGLKVPGNTPSRQGLRCRTPEELHLYQSNTKLGGPLQSAGSQAADSVKSPICTLMRGEIGAKYGAIQHPVHECLGSCLAPKNTTGAGLLPRP